jgi:hypothetical protein
MCLPSPYLGFGEPVGFGSAGAHGEGKRRGIVRRGWFNCWLIANLLGCSEHLEILF